MRQGDLLWSPTPESVAATRMGQFSAEIAARHGIPAHDYTALWQWSVTHLDKFWVDLWDHFGPPSSGSHACGLADPRMPGAQWFPDARVNYAEWVLAVPGRASGDTAIFARSQSRDDTTWTVDELRAQVGRIQSGLRRLGVSAGDRVAGYLPNIPEAVALMLATVGLGAIYTAAPPEFSARAALDRFRQVAPTVLVGVDGYVYGRHRIGRTDAVVEMSRELGLADRTVLLDYVGDPAPGELLTWKRFVQHDERAAFRQMPFDAPLWILYSSGTSGPPKPIVQSHGGIALEHLKHLGLHMDLGPQDTLFWFSTTGWVMWNICVSGLLHGAAITLYDGDPAADGHTALWQLARDAHVTYFGAGAAFYLACRSAGVDAQVTTVREIGSTGAPLPVAGYRWLTETFGPRIRLVSTSGGTDVCTSFVGGAPMLPVRAGEIACSQLGCAVEAWDADGQPVIGEQGEMVVTAPMPSMPLGFWGDEDGSRYAASYFDEWPGIWRHGDWITIDADGSCTISGRSDATLNRGGVRLGTAEFYDVLEELAEVADSLVVHLEDHDGGPGRLLLFVVMSHGHELTPDTRSMISARLRSLLSPRHVPDEIREIPGVPRTHSGKKLEIPVKRILQGTPVSTAVDATAVADPGLLERFVSSVAEK